MPTWIADEEVVFVDRNGRQTRGWIAVAAPERIDDTEATCAFALDGVDPVRVIHGASTLQALVLALRFGRARLEGFVSTGGRILEPESGEDVAVEAVLGR